VTGKRVKHAGQLVGVDHPALAPVRAAEIAPGPGIRASAAVRAWIRGTVTSYWHPAGTCRIGTGTDPGAVVDTDLRVHGITGLRIADASVIPVIPNAPCTPPCWPSLNAPPT